jgi:hypothetical protein
MPCETEVGRQQNGDDSLQTFSMTLGKMVATTVNFIAVIATLKTAFGSFLQLAFSLIDLFIDMLRTV